MENSALGPTLSFAPIASRYDARYQTPIAQLRACYERLVGRGVLPAKGIILDAGCGTGQISLPLAERGYEVRGYDVSPEMIAVAQSKTRTGWQATYAVADVRRLPENDRIFDAIVVSKLFPHVSEWQEAVREILRVLRAGACLVQLNDGGALENSVRAHFRRCADAKGHTIRLLGLHPYNKTALADFVVTQGCEEIEIDVTDLSWETSFTYGDVLDQFRERLFAEFWQIPAAVYDRIFAETSRWVDEQPEGRNTLETIRPSLTIQVFRKTF